MLAPYPIEIYLVCGTNDSATKRRPEKIINDFKSVLQLANERAEKVILSSIPPRCDDKADMKKIDNINQLLVIEANTLKAEFINNDQNFRYRNDKIDTSLLQPCDQLHLSCEGQKRLLENLGLDSRVRTSRSALPTKGHQQPNQSVIVPSWNYPLPPPADPAPLKPSLNNNANDANIIKFRAGNPLSNFHVTPIDAWGIKFKSVEHGYQYYKAVTHNIPTKAADIIHAHTPKEAKDIGGTIVTDQKWKEMKQGVMYHLLKQKANQCPVFCHNLMNTNGKTLVEDTTNEFWARGKHGSGQNTMGRLLMTLRESLHAQPHLHKAERFQPPPTLNYHTSPSHAPSHTPRQYQTFPHQYHSHSLPSNRSQQPRCFNCGERSHNVAKCRHSSPLQCYSCGDLGHKRKFCPKNNETTVSHNRPTHLNRGSY